MPHTQAQSLLDCRSTSFRPRLERTDFVPDFFWDVSCFLQDNTDNMFSKCRLPRRGFRSPRSAPRLDLACLTSRSILPSIPLT